MSAGVGTVTVLFTDLVGSTELSDRLGDEAAEELRRTHFRLLRDAVAAAGGREVKSSGDGLMVAFDSATGAVACAVAMQQAAQRHNERSGGQPLGLRVGLNVGDAIPAEGDYFGTAVNAAKRLCDAAESGQIVASDLVRALAGSQRRLRFRALGALTLKGIQDAVPACEVLWEPATAAPLALPAALEAREPGPAFVGRGRELALLRAEFDRAREGEHRLVLIAGEPGIGKTQLVAELCRSLHSEGATILYGRCDEEALVSYQPFVEGLRHYIAECPLDRLRLELGRAGGELRPLVPELAQRLPDLSQPLTLDPEGERDRLFEAVAEMLAKASQLLPLVLVLDDLHWATQPTLLMLRHLVRVREPMRVLVLGTYRNTELDRRHPLAGVLADLRSERPDLARLRLLGLDEEAVAAYLEAAGGRRLEEADLRLVRTLHAGTKGNPFFVGEVLAHLVETDRLHRNQGHWSGAGEITDLGLPEGVREVVTRRLSRLSDDANRALAVASVVGSSFSLALLERLPEAGEDPGRLLDAIEEAIRAGLVAEAAAGSFSFSHALIRQTLYSELTSTRRMRLHGKVGEAVEQLPDADEQVGALAHHFAEAALDGHVEKAADYALAAGRGALERLAYEEAVSHLERGLEVIELGPSPDRGRRADILLALAQARRDAGDMPGNQAASLAAADDARMLGSSERLARAATVYWSSGGSAIPDPMLPALCEEALAALGRSHPGRRASLLARLAQYHRIVEGRGAAADSLAAEALELARAAEDPAAISSSLAARIRLLYGTERVPERLALARDLRALAISNDDRGLLVTAAGFLYHAHLELGQRAAVDADLEALGRLARELGTRRSKEVALGAAAVCALLEGRFTEAEQLTEDEGRYAGGRTDVDVWRAGRFLLNLRERGGLRERPPSLQSFAEMFPHPGVRAFAAAFLAERGDETSALAELEALVSNDFAAMPRDHIWPTALIALAEACAVVAAQARAEPLYQALSPFSGQLPATGGAGCYGSADRGLGMLAALLGRLEAAEAHYLSALELEDGMKARPLAARTRLWYGRMLLARKRPGDCERARDLLDSALADADELGMSVVAEEARSLRRETKAAASR